MWQYLKKIKYAICLNVLIEIFLKEQRVYSFDREPQLEFEETKHYHRMLLIE
jgi:hypothetical protein